MFTLLDQNIQRMHGEESVSKPHSSRSVRYLVGLDVGSTTVKAIVEEVQSHVVVWRDYKRHEMRQQEMVLDYLLRIERDTGVSAENTKILVTGSGGAALSPLIGARYVQEVTAISFAVEHMCPEVNTVIELGGQDAKIIVFREDAKTGVRRKLPSMNDKCAAGTGAVIDKIAAKLHLPQEQLSNQPFRGIRLHPIAAKCGVFAETDINGLQKQGVPSDQLLASLFQAVVLQNLTVLTRGYQIQPAVLLLGGPNRFIRGLQEAWKLNIAQLWSTADGGSSSVADVETLIRVPENAEYFGAIGAVEFGRTSIEEDPGYRGPAFLSTFIESGRSAQKQKDARPALCTSAQELAEFKKQYQVPKFAPARFSAGETVTAFAGIDAGSTSTKAVLLGNSGDVLCKAYQLSNGNPIEDAQDVLDNLREQVERQGAHLEIHGLGTTGYAKDILKEVLKADLALVETIAHAKSARRYCPNPELIIDVGGQDIKIIILRDGQVRDFRLNTQCSAGNGYFLQATANSLGIAVEDYSDIAFSARIMPQFGYGCAVFLQSDVVNFQRQGWTKAEILAGLAAVLPKNVFLYVAGIPNIAGLGSRIVLQGGTQQNLAVVKAEVDFIHEHFRAQESAPEIILHPYCAEAGAIGAAIEVMEMAEVGRATSFIGLDELVCVKYKSINDETTRCHFCKNRCRRTFIDIQSHAPSNTPGRPIRRVIIANCEDGRMDDADELRTRRAQATSLKRATPNIVALAATEVWKSVDPVSVADASPKETANFSCERRAKLMARREHLRVAIPRVLSMYTHAPLFRTYLEALGVRTSNVVLSGFTTHEMFAAAAGKGAIDPCFPSKVCIAHIYDLIKKSSGDQRLDVIFFPMVDAVETPLMNCVGNACPALTLTPEAVKAAFTTEADLFRERQIDFMDPLLDLSDRKLFSLQMFEAWKDILGLSAAENDRAVEVAYTALEQFEARMRRETRAVLEMLNETCRIGIVILARPYHNDPGLNQGIPEEFQRRGYSILSQAYLPIDDDLLGPLFEADVKAGYVSNPLEIRDVWKHPFSASTSQKFWAAKFIARHPNLIAIELSSFKCGHDAPAYTVLRNIIEHSKTPFFTFRDLDENRPAASIKLRVETIDYFLKHQPHLAARRAQRRLPNEAHTDLHSRSTMDACND
jgi:predicted CoA-substrate-specific enzyme activase